MSDIHQTATEEHFPAFKQFVEDIEDAFSKDDPLVGVQQALSRLNNILAATHRCKACKALWRLWEPGEARRGDDGSWSCVQPGSGRTWDDPCCLWCDNVWMGNQIERIVK